MIWSFALRSADSCDPWGCALNSLRPSLNSSNPNPPTAPLASFSMCDCQGEVDWIFSRIWLRQPSHPIVFISGYGDIPMSVRAMKAAAIEFLTKPFRDQDLL